MSEPHCQRQGCSAPATCAIALNVPAQGWAIDLHQPLKAIVGLVVCDDHFAATKAEDFTALPQWRAIIQQALAGAGRAPPDFDRAFLSKVPLDDPRYLSFARQARNRPK